MRPMIAVRRTGYPEPLMMTTVTAELWLPANVVVPSVPPE
jgi:hypothetical protein